MQKITTRPTGLEPVTLGLEGREEWRIVTLQGDLGSIILGDVVEETPFPELVVALQILLGVGADPYEDDDDYVRRYAGPIRAMDAGEIVGRVELRYIHGSRAMENGFDIVDVCDALGQDEYDYAWSVYTNGTIDASIAEAPIYNDVLVVHELSVEPKYHGLGIEEQVVRKIAATIGYHTAAIILDHRLANTVDVESIPTKEPTLRAIVDF